MHTLLFAFFPEEKARKIKQFYVSNKELVVLNAQTEEAYQFYIRNHKIDIFFFYYDAPTENIKKILIHLHRLPIYTLQPCNIVSDKTKYPAFDLSDFICTNFYHLTNWNANFHLLINFIEESHQSTYQLKGLTSGFFQAKSGRQLVNIPLKDILFIESVSKKSILHTLDGTFTVSMPLYKIQDTLPENVFVRTHRSFVVNLHKIFKVDHDSQKIIFCNYHSCALISRNYRKIVTMHSTQLQNFLV
ncbi:MAG: LytTR family DNA-binding domain-containing protein [Bacillota bacterium]